MSRLGTDVLALACIVGGAAVGGVATMGLMYDSHGERHEHADHAVECAVVEDTGARSQVVVTLGSHKNVIVTTPEVRVHQPHCVSMGSFEWTEAAEFEIQGAQLRMEQARMEMEMARQMMEIGVIDLEGLDVKLEGIGFDLDLDLENISEEIEQSLQLEMVRLEEELKRLDEIGR